MPAVFCGATRAPMCWLRTILETANTAVYNTLANTPPVLLCGATSTHMLVTHLLNSKHSTSYHTGKTCPLWCVELPALMCWLRTS